MTYRKFKGDRLFTGKTFVSGEMVLVAHADGTIEALLPESEAGDGIEYLEGIISPGFVNAHCHLELSFLKDKIPPHSGMVPFLLQVMHHQGSEGEEVHEAMHHANETMFKNGIVAVGDISNTPVSIGVKQRSSLYYHTFVETAGFVPSGAEPRARFALQTAASFMEAGLTATVSPHAPYSVSGELLAIINQHTAGKLVSIHNQESSAETLFFQYKKGGLLTLYEQLGIQLDFFRATGKNSIEWWLPHFNLQQQLLLVHNVCTTEADIFFMKACAEQTGIPFSALHFCLCPNANLYIQQLLPDLPLLLKHGTNLMIGTDSYASNHSLDCWNEVRTLQEVYPEVPLEVLLRAATLNGAETLGIADKYGSFEQGKKPGVVLLKGELSRRVL
ncbi:MAG: amidohydrolase family protein [Chitinophagaceae bacterium]